MVNNEGVGMIRAEGQDRSYAVTPGYGGLDPSLRLGGLGTPA